MVIFRAFLFIFFRPLDSKSEKKNSRKSTNKKILALFSVITFGKGSYMNHKRSTSNHPNCVGRNLLIYYYPRPINSRVSTINWNGGNHRLETLWILIGLLQSQLIQDWHCLHLNVSRSHDNLIFFHTGPSHFCNSFLAKPLQTIWSRSGPNVSPQIWIKTILTLW